MLLVWARARIFADLNDMPLCVTGWNALRPGPFLRGELPRFYGGFFTPSREVSLRRRLWSRVRFDRVYEPILDDDHQSNNALYIFSEIPHWKDYFAGIRDHRDQVRGRLYDLIRPSVLRELQGSAAPVISIHVRCGDFRPLAPREDFSKVGHVRTPLDYFAAIIEGIRLLVGRDIRVTIFSDGTNYDIAALLRLPNVHHQRSTTAIADMLLMSKSEIIVPSAGSTFGYWAGFLSEAAIILHPDHIHSSIRPESVNRNSFEGGVAGPTSQWPGLLRRQLSKIAAKLYDQPGRSSSA
jgi:hypothetical protein